MSTEYEDAVNQLRYPGVSRCLLDLYKNLNMEYRKEDIAEPKGSDED